MSDTQEKLRRAMMTGPNRWAEATINGKLVSYYEIHDETILLDLIDSAKREAQIKMLRNMKKSLMVARVNPGLKPLQLPEDARIQQMIADEFDRNIALLEQSEESE